MNAPFPGFDLAIQPIAYPDGLGDSNATTANTTSTNASVDLVSAPDHVEIERLRLENAQLQRKLFQKQQQIQRLMDHVNRLARVLGELKRSHSK
jgi:hypothetical protein